MSASIAPADRERVRGLVKSFRGPHGPIEAVRGVAFDISAGQTVALLYWLVQASHAGLGGHLWTRTAWLVIAVWTAVLGALAVRAYRRDTGRV
jgi:hypothetical protein